MTQKKCCQCKHYITTQDSKHSWCIYPYTFMDDVSISLINNGEIEDTNSICNNFSKVEYEPW